MGRLAVSIIASSLSVLGSCSPLSTPSTFSDTLSPIRTPLSKLILTEVSANDVLNRGLARMAGFNARTEVLEALEDGLETVASSKSIKIRSQASGVATNYDVTYTTSVTVGNSQYTLIVDNTWVGAGRTWTGVGNNTNRATGVTYGSGSFSGVEWIAPTSFAGLTVSQQAIGVASRAEGFGGVDGIIGFGPIELTYRTVDSVDFVYTFMDNLKRQGAIATEVLGVHFHPENGGDSSDANGELTLGGVDSSAYTGSLTYVPRSSTFPFKYYWGVDVTTITYNKTPLLMSGASAIVDTGTTLIYVPHTVYQKFLQASGGSTDSNTGFARYKTAPMGTVTFSIGSISMTLSPSQYLVPAAQYQYFGFKSGYFYSWIADSGSDDSKSVNFIIGQKFLENYYSVYDTTNSRLGFARAI